MRRLESVAGFAGAAQGWRRDPYRDDAQPHPRSRCRGGRRQLCTDHCPRRYRTQTDGGGAARKRGEDPPPRERPGRRLQIPLGARPWLRVRQPLGRHRHRIHARGALRRPEPGARAGPPRREVPARQRHALRGTVVRPATHAAVAAQGRGGDLPRAPLQGGARPGGHPRGDRGHRTRRHRARASRGRDTLARTQPRTPHRGAHRPVGGPRRAAQRE